MATEKKIGLVYPKCRDIYYDGGWHKVQGGKTVPIYNPATNESLGEIADAGTEDVDAAVKAAHKAFQKWRLTPPMDRVAMMREAASRLRDNAEELGMLDAVDSGNPLRTMIRDSFGAAGTAEYFCGLITELKGESIPTGDGELDFTVRQPYGVVAGLGPFNHPVLLGLLKVIPPLLAGNTAVLKPSEYTSLTTLRVAELWHGIFPPGVFNVVTGARETGAALVAHPLTPMVTLTGSAPTGRAVMRGAADRMKHVVLELGGKNAIIGFPDADPRKVALGCCAGMNLTGTAGQSCMSTSRLFLHRKIYDEGLEALVAAVSALHCGDPTDIDCEVGAMTSRPQFEKVMNYIQIGKDEGARLMCGGGQPADPRLKKGLFVEPTVFADVKQSMRIATEEIFGPVICVLKWDDEEQLLADVNAVEYGLSGAVWTKDLATAHRVGSRIDSGYIWINRSGGLAPGSPFGGMKQSGIGREFCLSQLLDCTQIKNFYITLNP